MLPNNIRPLLLLTYLLSRKPDRKDRVALQTLDQAVGRTAMKVPVRG